MLKKVFTHFFYIFICSFLISCGDLSKVNFESKNAYKETKIQLSLGAKVDFEIIKEAIKRSNDLNVIRLLLEKCKNINEFDDSLLFYVFWKNEAEKEEHPLFNETGKLYNDQNIISLVSLLIEFGIDVNSPISFGEKFAHLLYFSKTVEMAKLLIKAGALVNPPSSKDFIEYGTVFVYGRPSIDTTIYLVEKGLKLNLATFDFDGKDGIKILNTLLHPDNGKFPININEKDYAGSSILIKNILRSLDMTMLHFLKENGANFNIRNLVGQTPLIELALQHITFKKNKQNFYDVIAFLLENGVQINSKDVNYKTALDYLLESPVLSIDFIDALLDFETNVNSLDLITLFSHNLSDDTLTDILPIVKKLIQKGANINAKNEFGETVLDLAAKNQRPQVTQFLLSKKAQYTHNFFTNANYWLKKENFFWELREDWIKK